MSEQSVSVPREEIVASAGAPKIFLRSWRPAGKPRAIVVICHGFNSHGGQYLNVAEAFAAAGLSVYALDLRGRGKSEGERFFVSDVDEYVSDVAAVVKVAKGREPGLPVFLLGHSAGGVVSCCYAVDHQVELAGLICESFAYRVPAPGVALPLLKVVSRFAPRLKTLKLKNRDFSRIPSVVQRLESDPLTANEQQPAMTMAAMIRANESLDHDLHLIHIPVLILHGTADKATLPAGSQRFYDRAETSDKNLKLYEGHFHDLLQDTGQELVMADILAWIDAHI
jgi:acylglycerol lipase